ncbi:dTDP-4-amino-4,6-dideoxygalactose transaminase [Membranicola marinus]|uniref:dTDP-4-amino-4,6-dideoxygalactose transaminase n=1 Tax=Membranihabitans marinus TaxID=1227546 RepID=A0A953L8R8_9BACT|nr:dTDP-4-amino-4,6-dideoxygalactose transaminase [Membranihabitans marinus]MBY5956848.1 dTDP-4-amino-4,6-dideoxygalactose transaminase [Membranihabitans marinus]
MLAKTIPFNQPYLANALPHIACAINKKHVSGNGYFTKKCHAYFRNLYARPTLLTTSCTVALEMATLLAEIGPGDEVIIPSFTFVSTANPFLLRGAKVVFADTMNEYPNLDVDAIEGLITPRTKALVCMHYGGVACDMEKLTALAAKYGLMIIEDAAHAILSYYKNQHLGTFGRFSTLSFHETKNITSGKGGLLILNQPEDISRAEILWEKGTNRTAFHRNETQKYEWMDLGSSYLPSEINAAVLYSQIEEINAIQKRRTTLWQNYYSGLLALETQGKIRLANLPDYATINGHLFFMECDSQKTRDRLIADLRKKGIHSVFHYLPLHESPFFKCKHDGRPLNNSVRFSERIIRLPLFYELKNKEQEYIIETIYNCL